MFTGYIRSNKKHELTRFRMFNCIFNKLDDIGWCTLRLRITVIKTKRTVTVFDSCMMNIALRFECNSEKIMSMTTISNDKRIILFIFQQPFCIDPTQWSPIPTDLDKIWNICISIRRNEYHIHTSFSFSKLASWAIIDGLSWLSFQRNKKIYLKQTLLF